MRFLYPVGGLTDCYGILTAPNHKGVPAGIKAGLPWAADVGCLEGPAYVKRVNWDKLIPWLELMQPYRKQCLFIAGADIVGKARETLEAYGETSRYFAGWPLTYVIQNGAESLPIPSDCSAVFLGGDTDYKESMTAVSVIKRAQQMGKHIHIGRVNWGRRYQMFNVLKGSEHFTCDGTRQRFDGIDKTRKAWTALESQPPLIQI